MDIELRRTKAQVIINNHASSVGTWPGRVLMIPVVGQMMGGKMYLIMIEESIRKIILELSTLFNRKLTPEQQYALKDRFVSGFGNLVEGGIIAVAAAIPFIGGEISNLRASSFIKTAGWSIYFILATQKDPLSLSDKEIQECIEKAKKRAKI